MLLRYLLSFRRHPIVIEEGSLQLCAAFKEAIAVQTRLEKLFAMGFLLISWLLLSFRRQSANHSCHYSCSC